MSLTNEMAAVLAEQHFAALATGDTALAARCIHPAHVNHMAADEPPACATPGVPGFLATSAWLRLAFSDLSFEIIEITADGGRTMAHVRMSGRQTGPFVVFPDGARPIVFAPTGRAFGVRQVHVFGHRDGQHGEHTAVRDDLGMMTQLGHLPPSPKVAWHMARTALTGYRARAIREAIWVSADAAAGAAAAVASDRSLRRLIESVRSGNSCVIGCPETRTNVTPDRASYDITDLRTDQRHPAHPELTTWSQRTLMPRETPRASGEPTPAATKVWLAGGADAACDDS